MRSTNPYDIRWRSLVRIFARLRRTPQLRAPEDHVSACAAAPFPYPARSAQRIADRHVQVPLLSPYLNQMQHGRLRQRYV